MSYIPFRSYQAHLRTETLSIVAGFIIVIGYIWLWLNIWLVTGSNTPLSGWFGSLFLIVIGLGSNGLKTLNPRFAVYLLIVGGFIATVSAFYTLRSPATPYLFIVPMAFTSVLLSRQIVFLEAFIASAIVALSGAPDTWVAIITILLVACSSFLSARNLNTTLAWLSDAYERAHSNEYIARERQAELQLLLKALDDATHSLERANQRLIIERNEAESAQRLKQQFAQTISHELRTPLNLILGFIDVMAHSPEHYGEQLPISYMRDLSIIHKNAQHLQKLVNDVLDLARIEATQMNIVGEVTDVAVLVQDTINITRHLIEQQGLSLSVEIEPGLPHLTIDPARIRQVLLNLLNNAARFTDTGGITVRVYRHENEVVFSVTDTGIGIATQDLERIFKEFEQLDSTTRRRYSGAGLGLAISQRFIELHRGRVWVDSQLDQGSTFYFSLPIQPYQTTALVTGGPTLMVVSDNPSANQPFAHAPYQVVITETLDQAETQLQQDHPTAILIDTAGKKVTSEGLQALANQWRLKRTPIFAYPIPKRMTLRSKVIKDYLVKPVAAHRLREVLKQFTQPIRTILIVDDHQDFTKLFSRMLQNYCVLTAYSGTEALALLEYKQPDLIFVDYFLPDMVGSELTERIHCQQPAVPIIMISTQDEIDSANTLSAPLIVARDEPFGWNETLHLIQKISGV